MATWPANGDTDWNTKSLAYLAVSHTTTGYHKFDVNGTLTDVRTKYLTGTLDADSETSVAHGVTVTNILHVSVICYNDDSSVYLASEMNAAAYSGYEFKVQYDATNIIITGVGSYQQGNAYKIKIDYTV